MDPSTPADEDSFVCLFAEEIVKRTAQLHLIVEIKIEWN